jgi:hypothetical protein
MKFILLMLIGCFSFMTPNSIIKKNLPMYINSNDCLPFSKSIGDTLENILKADGIAFLSESEFTDLKQLGWKIMKEFISDLQNTMPRYNGDRPERRFFSSIPAKGQYIKIVCHTTNDTGEPDSIGFVYGLLPTQAEGSKPLRKMYSLKQTGCEGEPEKLARWIYSKLQ